MLQSKMAPYTVSRSEEEVGEKVDRCVTDAIVKAGKYSTHVLKLIFQALLISLLLVYVSFVCCAGILTSPLASTIF